MIDRGVIHGQDSVDRPSPRSRGSLVRVTSVSLDLTLSTTISGICSGPQNPHSGGPSPGETEGLYYTSGRCPCERSRWSSPSSTNGVSVPGPSQSI